MQNKFIIFLIFIAFSLPVNAHTFTGMIGFYDGLSHPVLGADHFLAMVCVGIVSAQIGGRAIWIVPSTFVLIMIIGGIIGMSVEINKGLQDQAISVSETEMVYYFLLNNRSFDIVVYILILQFYLVYFFLNKMELLVVDA